MGIAEKKAMRATLERLTEETQAWLDKSGLKIESQIDFSSIETEEATITKSINVPSSIIGYLTTLTEDQDYKEAFSEVKGIKFVPVQDEAFDYEASASLNEGLITVNFLPLQSFHGGYERSIKGLF